MKIYFITGIFIILLVFASYYYKNQSMLVYNSLIATQQELNIWKNDSTTRIEHAKDRIVDQLQNCETGTMKNSDDYIKYDPHASKRLADKDLTSYGALQFKISTVQVYSQGISNLEAIEIAMDHEKAHALAKKILFEKQGASNWYTCDQKIGLSAQVKIINSL